MGKKGSPRKGRQMREKDERQARVTKRGGTRVMGKKNTRGASAGEPIRAFDSFDEDQNKGGRNPEREAGAYRREDTAERRDYYDQPRRDERYEERYERERYGERRKRADRYDREDRYSERRQDRDDRYDDRYDRSGRYDDRRSYEDRYGREERYEARDRDEARYHDRRDREPYGDREDRRPRQEETGGAAPRRGQSDGSEREKAVKKPVGNGEYVPFIHQILPYVLFWVSVFAAASFVLRDLCHMDSAMGMIGGFLADFLCGLFGAAAYFVPAFAIVISLRWRKYVREGTLFARVFLSLLFLTLLSGIIHVFLDQDRAIRVLSADVLYHQGVSRIGGGLFGGFVGEWLGFCLRLPGTCVLAIPVLLIVGIYMVGLTPSALYQRVTSKWHMMKEKKTVEPGRAPQAGLNAPEHRESLPENRGRTARRGNSPEKPAEPAWCEPQPLSESYYDFGEDEPRRGAASRARYTADEDRVQTPPTRGNDAVSGGGYTRQDPIHELLDLQEDEPEMTPRQREGVRTILTQAGQDADGSRERMDSLIDDMVRRADAPAQTASTADEEKKGGSYYAPFALPVRPEPKRENADPGAGSRIVITPHGESSQSDRSYEDSRSREPAAFAEKERASGLPHEEQLGRASRDTVPPVSSDGAAWRETARGAENDAVRDTAENRNEKSAPGTQSPLSFADPVPTRNADVRRDSPVSGAAMTFEAPERELIDDDEVEENYPLPAEKHEATAATPRKETGYDTPLVSFAREEAGKTAPKAAPETTRSSLKNADDRDFDFLDSTGPEEFETAAPKAPARASDTHERPARPVASPEQRPARPAEPVAKPVASRSEPVADELAAAGLYEDFRLPSPALLNEDRNDRHLDYTADVEEKKMVLRDTLASFGIDIQEDIRYSHGPTITRYELRPGRGVSVRSVTNRADDLALNLAASIRIEAPIPGKPAIGVEVPNAVRETVYMRTMLESDAFRNSTKPLEVPLGLTVDGQVQMCNIAAMPHLLVAGSTGSGKSVCINTIMVGLLMKNTPYDLRFIMIDPKKVEFSAYEHIPHLYLPIVTDMARAAGVLACAVNEMERRYTLLQDVGVKKIDDYNRITANDPDREHLPYIVIIIDEFADLKMGASNNDVELLTCRLAQKARAAGMHLIIGTQRPTVEVITGNLKNNIPSRIAFLVKDTVSSRTILDVGGAENLIGRGDMLYMPAGSSSPIRAQGAYAADEEIDRIASFVRDHNAPVQYNQAFMEQLEMEMARVASENRKGSADDGGDEDGGEESIFYRALELAVSNQKVATSLLQRRLGVGYGRAAKLIDRMEQLGLVGPPDGNKPRKLLPKAQEYLDRMTAGEDEGDGGEDEFADYN